MTMWRAGCVTLCRFCHPRVIGAVSRALHVSSTVLYWLATPARRLGACVHCTGAKLASRKPKTAEQSAE